MNTNIVGSHTPDLWQKLYRMGAVAAGVLLVYCLATMVIMGTAGGQPETIEETFRLLQDNRLMGLLRLDLLTVLVMPLYYLLFLCFWAALKPLALVNSTLATLMVFIGVTLFLAMPSVFSYTFLSDRYAAAASDVQRTQLIAAGEAIWAADIWHGTGAQVGGLLLQSGAVLISVIMLRSPHFGKSTGIVGIVTHGLDLAHILVGFFSPVGGAILMAIGGTLYLIWFPMILRCLLRLSRATRALSEGNHEPTQVARAF